MKLKMTFLSFLCLFSTAFANRQTLDASGVNAAFNLYKVSSNPFVKELIEKSGTTVNRLSIDDKCALTCITIIQLSNDAKLEVEDIQVLARLSLEPDVNADFLTLVKASHLFVKAGVIARDDETSNEAIAFNSIGISQETLKNQNNTQILLYALTKLAFSENIHDKIQFLKSIGVNEKLREFVLIKMAKPNFIKKYMKIDKESYIVSEKELLVLVKAWMDNGHL